MLPNKIAAGNCHRGFQLEDYMKFGYHHCSQRQTSAVAPQLWRDRPVAVQFWRSAEGYAL